MELIVPNVPLPPTSRAVINARAIISDAQLASTVPDSARVRAWQVLMNSRGKVSRQARPLAHDGEASA